MKVAIIGGSGKMGSWFARFLLKEGKDVLLVGRSIQKLEKVKRRLDVSITTNMAFISTVPDETPLTLSSVFDPGLSKPLISALR